jgi:4a-hydroxytetrahydrobiopterin dehydratase
MTRMGSFSNWRLDNGELVREFRFASYLDGACFALRVAEEAEKMDHHPVLIISWRTVLFRVSTHSPNGLTLLDFELARRAMALAAQGADETF